MSDVKALADRFLALMASNLKDAEGEVESILEELAANPAVAEELLGRRGELDRQLKSAKIRRAECTANLAACALCLSKPVPPEGAHYELAGGPAHEIALAASHITRYARDVVPYEDPPPDETLGDPDDPLFDSYLSVYANAVHGIRRAAYYMLEASESFAALASSPPEQETFPPLPFPVVWIEMTHLAPFMRFADQRGKERSWETLDVLGVLIAAVEQGSVWDVYLPFQFDNDAEFFFMAARIAPDRVISRDPSFGAAVLGLDLVRAMAVSAVHLITARNVLIETFPVPRPQRKRMAAEMGQEKPRLYFVNLHGSGERNAASAAASSREYHVRWLVRGHWRHITGGRRFCTCCDPPQIASWVEPYIKGPAGAPWKGRQVRKTDGAA